MPNQPNQLAIVIPAYKARFLCQALESIARQTVKRFTVYVGDDASPDNIQEICDAFSDRLDLVYTRFSENLGHHSLVSHWNRCVEMSSEPWVWLFCDDDVMEPECVEMFYRTLARENGRFRVLRFNTLIIDDDSQIVKINPPHPHVESGIRFIYHRLNYERMNYVTEYIFAREAFNENKGMVEFPLAWCSDDASWLAFSGSQGILTIPGAAVHWRQSTSNISPSGAKHQATRIEASLRFIGWLDNFIEINGTSDQYITRDIIKELSKSWFRKQINEITPISLLNFLKYARLINTVTRKGLVSSCLILAFYNARYYFNKFVSAR